MIPRKPEEINQEYGRLATEAGDFLFRIFAILKKMEELNKEMPLAIAFHKKEEKDETKTNKND